MCSPMDPPKHPPPLWPFLGSPMAVPVGVTVPQKLDGIWCIRILLVGVPVYPHSIMVRVSNASELGRSPSALKNLCRRPPGVACYSGFRVGVANPSRWVFLNRRHWRLTIIYIYILNYIYRNRQRNYQKAQKKINPVRLVGLQLFMFPF